jgi:phytoene dehydrogenase-like protein
MGHWGWTWSRWTTAFDLPGVAPSGGLYLAGAHAHPGGSLEAVGMATAAIAADVGPATR